MAAEGDVRVHADASVGWSACKRGNRAFVECAGRFGDRKCRRGRRWSRGRLFVEAGCWPGRGRRNGRKRWFRPGRRHRGGGDDVIRRYIEVRRRPRHRRPHRDSRRRRTARRRRPSVTPEEIRRIAATNEPVRELLRFAVGDDYFYLREKLGTAIAKAVAAQDAGRPHADRRLAASQAECPADEDVA